MKIILLLITYPRLIIAQDYGWVEKHSLDDFNEELISLKCYENGTCLVLSNYQSSNV